MKFGFTLGVAALCAVGFAQSFSDNFESETGSAAGTLLTGQNGWYLPGISGSLDGNVYTYSGNALGLATNASGGNNFAGAAANGTGSYRMQHAVAFTNSGVWTLSLDFNFNWSGSTPAVNNLGSVSLQTSGVANYFQTLYSFADTNNPTSTYTASFGVADAAGVASGQTVPTTRNGILITPGAQWSGLVLNHWYRQTVTWDYSTNQITSTTLQDLTINGSIASANPADYYLSGGANNIQGLPSATDIRLFVSGGSTTIPNTNFGGYDNLSVGPVPEPASMAALGIGALALLRRRRKA
jgi:hypothetical protein